MRAALPRNPVLDRELKQRLRTRRSTIVITAYLGLLSLILYGVYRGAEASSMSGFGGPIASQAATVGRSLFDTMVIVMLGLVLFIVPGLTADAVTGERERQTLVPLQVTLLAPRSIIAGKLLAALAFVALLVVATLPLVGISFVLGGVSVGQAAKAVAAVLATAVVVATISLLCSSIARTSQGAMVLAQSVALFLAIGAPILYAGQTALDDDDGDRPAPTVLILNPFLAAADAIAPGDADLVADGSSPLQGMSRFVRELEDPAFAQAEQQVFMGPGVMVAEEVAVATTVVDGAQPAPFVAPEVPEVPRRAGLARIPFWLRSATVLGAVAVVSFVLASRRIATPSDRSAT